MSTFNPTVTSFLLVLLASTLLHTILGSDVVSFHIKYFLKILSHLKYFQPLTIIASFFLAFATLKCRLDHLYSLTFKHLNLWGIRDYVTSKIHHVKLFNFLLTFLALLFFRFKDTWFTLWIYNFSNSLSVQKSNSDCHSILILLLAP